MEPRHLRFGIPSLDTLFGDSEGNGIRLPEGDGGFGDPSTDPSNSSVSICISGPDGTGKSILGLHLASRYVADCALAGSTRPKVLYISTDLKFGMALKVWTDFALDYPDRRKVPFEGVKRDGDMRVGLTPCSPLKGARGGEPLSEYLSRGSGREAYFVDLASTTVGDDWGFVNRVLSAIEKPGAGQPRHLIVIDSVEGFETLVGERDAFGLVRERRSRIAQVLRSAGDKCHTLFIVEEPKEGERLPEEFVTDVVIRLRSVLVRDYVRRTAEIEKARGHAHVRGQHTYLIRSGTGSTTGQRENPDDPFVENVTDPPAPPTARRRQPYQSYLHICHSLHHSYRKVMTKVGRGRPPEQPERYAAFGIRYLDEMIGIGNEDFRREGGNDLRGLRCGTTTALIGNPETQKGPLGVAFLSRCFRTYAERYGQTLDRLMRGKASAEERRILEEFLPGGGRPKGEQNKAAPGSWEKATDGDFLLRTWADNARQPANVLRHRVALRRIFSAGAFEADDKGIEKYTEDPKGEWESGVTEIDRYAKAAAWLVGPPDAGEDGIPILLTTQDINAQKLVREFLPWLLRKVPELKEHKGVRGSNAALRILMEQYTICRRLEIHDLPSAVLIHILQRAIDEARSFLHGDGPAKSPKEMSELSQAIRIVIDDFSILKDTYIEIREEPLLSRFIVFYLGQQGVTTLLIDTQPGRPDTTVASPLHSELRSLVDNRIYTWRFPFYGEDRVAIATIPTISGDPPAVVRELRRGIRSASGPESLPLVVDPHFELYSDIEKGEPQPIPLEVWLFEETPAFRAYIEEENLRYASMFTPRPSSGAGGGAGKVILGIPSTDYDEFRDTLYLQRDTRLDHSLVFQVDEFWVMPTSPGLRRAGTFRLQWKYLNAITAEKSKEEKYPGEKWKREWAVDPFRLFQKTAIGEGGARKAGGPENEKDGKKHRRRYEFDYRGYAVALGEGLDAEAKGLKALIGSAQFKTLSESEQQKALADSERLKASKASVDRVPFMWDFGFLLCKVRAWEDAKDVPLSIWNHGNDGEKPKTVGDVWRALPKASSAWPKTRAPRPSWRLFLEACYQLARKQAYSSLKPATAFDIHGASAQTLSSLVLEIWASEIYDRDEREHGDGLTNLSMTKRRWSLDTEADGLIEWLTKYRGELFKTWLLLVEVLDFDVLAESIRAGTLRIWKPSPTALAVRHWYKTACQTTEGLSFDDPVVPIGLPGHFSVRGDWSLAVAGGSRSERLADRAVDLLNSRRAHHARLHKGLGLPTRKLDDSDLPTSILTVDFGSKTGKDAPARRLSRVKYDNLMSIGSDADNQKKGFHWFWRSGLLNYHRHTRIWQDWLGQMILWWDRMRYVERDNWTNGFERYDDAMGGQNIEAWDKFEVRCDRLIKELRQATLD